METDLERSPAPSNSQTTEEGDNNDEVLTGSTITPKILQLEGSADGRSVDSAPEPAPDVHNTHEPISENESQEWLKGIGTASDSKDAFRRGAFCLKAQALPVAIYWMNQALKDARIPKPPPIPEREVLERLEPTTDMTILSEEAAPEPDTATQGMAETATEFEPDDESRQTRSKSRSRSCSPMKTKTKISRVPEPVDADLTVEATSVEQTADTEKPTEAMQIEGTNEGVLVENMTAAALVEDATEAAQADDTTEAAQVEDANEVAQAQEGPNAMVLEDQEEEQFDPDADLAKVLVFRARALQLSGDHIAAIGDFASSLRLTPVGKMQIGALVLRAKSYAAINRADLALQDYKNAQNLDPNEISVYIGRSAMYVDQRQYDLALNDCQRALELDPKHVIANRRAGLIFADTQRIPQAVRAFNRALAVRADYECLTLRGRSYVQMGEFDSALADYSMAVSIAPNVPLAYGHRSVLYAHLKRLDLAVNDATAFIRLSSGEQCISAYQNRGVWWAQMGEYDKAIQDFTFVIEQQPTNSFAFMSRGTAYSQLKQYDKSIEDWLKVADMTPDMVKAYYNLGKQFFYNKDYANAEKYYQEVIRLAPENPAGYCERARTLCEQQKWGEALQCWTESLQHDRQNPELYIGRAQTYLKLGDVEAAIRDYSDCIQLNPADPSPYERRAACFLRLKQLDSGRQDLITAKKLRWTIEFEKVSYENALKAKNQAAPSHMAVVRAAKAAAAASVSNSIPLPPPRPPAFLPDLETKSCPTPESNPDLNADADPSISDQPDADSPHQHPGPQQINDVASDFDSIPDVDMAVETS